MTEPQDRFARLFDDREADAAMSALLDDARRDGGPLGGGSGDEAASGVPASAAADGGPSLADRLRGASGPLTVVVRGVGSVRGTPREVVPDAAVLAAPDGSEWVLPYRAVMWVDGLTDSTGAAAGSARAAAAPPPGVARDPASVRVPGMPGLLRRWVRDRLPVTLHLVDGGTLTGTPVAAGSDHLDLAEHGADEPRHAQAARRTITVPYASIGALRRR